MTPRLHLVGLLVTALILATPRAHADDAAPDTGAVKPDPGDVGDDGVHVVSTALWGALIMAVPAAYYWSTQSEQEVDWTRPSWRDKLTLHSWRFDTNAFHVNALRHPFVGVADYQIARSNGFGVLGATAFAYLTGVFWELCVEYREDPSINDMIMNGAGGLGLGEPLYQIGQLWRGGELSAGDRLRTAAFSPFAAAQDLWRPHRLWHRPRAWADFAVEAGLVRHRVADGVYRDELAVSADIDVVRHAPFVTPGAHDGTINPGAWSRVMFGARLADLGSGYEPVMTTLRTRTALAGVYRQDDAGDGALLALGAGFTYRRDVLDHTALPSGSAASPGTAGLVDHESDHLAIAHLVGPQVQLSRRTGTTELRWDLAAYADFALVDAHVFGPRSPLPPPPPYLSTLQVAGYYDAGGASLETRVRADHGMWHADLELTVHQLWSLDFADRVEVSPDVSRTAASVVSTAGSDIPATPHGVSDLRGYGHAEVGVRTGRYGVAATADAALRHGAWRELSRTTGDWTLGVLATASL